MEFDETFWKVTAAVLFLVVLGGLVFGLALPKYNSSIRGKAADLAKMEMIDEILQLERMNNK